MPDIRVPEWREPASILTQWVWSASQVPEDDVRWQPHVIMPKKEPFDDVLLGPLLGQGSFGRVYRGIWNGAQVAIKVSPCLSLHAFLQARLPFCYASCNVCCSSVQRDVVHPRL